MPLWTETACWFRPKPPAGFLRNRLSETPKFAVDRALNIGVTDAKNGTPAQKDLSIDDLPVFNVQCTDGPMKGQTFQVTDLGVAMITGNCEDIGKTKVPVLRGLAGRSQYFHNGSATEIENLINFYNDRFQIGLTPQEMSDLAAFLETL